MEVIESWEDLDRIFKRSGPEAGRDTAWAEIERLRENLALVMRSELAAIGHMAKAERERDVLNNLFVIGCYEIDSDCTCEGKCKYCAAMGCEACCEGYSAEHGSLSEDELAAKLRGRDTDNPQPLTGFVRAAVVEEAGSSIALDGETFAVGAERWVDPERPFPFLRSSPAADAEPETDEPVRHWCSFPCEKWVEPGEALAHFGHVIVRGDT